MASETGITSPSAGVLNVAASGNIVQVDASGNLKNLTAGGSVVVSGATSGTNAIAAPAVAGTSTTTTLPGYSVTLFGKPVADVSLTAQNASINTTNLVAAAPAGLYCISWHETITTAAGTSSSILVTIGWTNPNGSAKTSTLASLNGGALQTTADTSNTAGSELQGSIIVNANAASNITYATTYASNAATVMQYALRITVERLQ